MGFMNANKNPYGYSAGAAGNTPKPPGSIPQMTPPGLVNPVTPVKGYSASQSAGGTSSIMSAGMTAYDNQQGRGSIPSMINSANQASNNSGIPSIMSAGMSASGMSTPKTQGSIPPANMGGSRYNPNYQGSVPQLTPMPGYDSGNPSNGYAYGGQGYGGNPTEIPNAITKYDYTAPGGSSSAGNGSSAGAGAGSTSSGLTDEHKRVQDYITKDGRWGTAEQYGQNNIERYQRGEISYNALKADAERVGYAIPGLGVINPTINGTTDTTTPEHVDYRALAEAEFATKRAGARSSLDQRLSSLSSGWEQSQADLKDQRVLDNLFFERNNNPFGGQYDYRSGLMGREREKQDAASLAHYNDLVAAANSDYSNQDTSYQDQIGARAYQLQQDALANERANAPLTGTFKGGPTMDALKVAADNAYRDKTFNFEAEQAKIKNGQWDKSFDLEMSKWAGEQGIKWANLGIESKKALAQIAIEQMNANTSRMNANTSSKNANWAQDSSNPDNKLKNAQIDKLNKPDYKGLSADQIYNNVRSMYTEPVFGPPDLLGKQGSKVGEKMTTDPAKREQMFLQVVDAHLPSDDETYQVLHLLGLSKSEIETFKKKYSSR